MTPKEINIAIAEHLGILFFHEQERLWHVKGSGFFTSKDCAVWKLPNYYADINEIIKAIKWASSSHEDWCWGTFGITMNNILGIAHHEFDWDYVIKTDASQYCEGFLRVFDKWKEV